MIKCVNWYLSLNEGNLGKLLLIPLSLSLRPRDEASCSGSRQTPLHLSPVSDELELGGVPLGLTNRARDKTRDGSRHGETPLPPSSSDEGQLFKIVLIPLGFRRGAGDQTSGARHGEAGLGGAQGHQEAESQEHLRTM